MKRTFVINPSRITKYLFLLVAFFVVVHLITTLVKRDLTTPTLSAEHHLVAAFYNYFHLSGEDNFPTFYSSSLLLAASGLLFIVFKAASSDKPYWLLLSSLFLFLSIDEAIQIHEAIGDILEARYKDLPAAISWAWVIPYGLLIMILVVVFFQFLYRLTARTRKLFIVAGIVYIFNAFVLEMVEAYVNGVFKGYNKVNGLLFIVEESGEMAGVIIFIYALLDLLADYKKEFTVSFS